MCAQDFNDKILPFRAAHGFPISLQQGGALQFARSDLVAPFFDKPLQPFVELGESLGFFA